MSISSNEIRARLIEENLSPDHAEGIWERLEALSCDCCDASLTEEINAIKEHKNWKAEDEKQEPEFKVTKAHLQCRVCERSGYYDVTSDSEEELTTAIKADTNDLFHVDMDGSTVSCDHCDSTEITTKFGYEVEAYVQVRGSREFTVFTETVGDWDQIHTATDAEILVGSYPYEKENIYSEDYEVSSTPFEKISAPDTSEKDEIISALVQQIKEYSGNELVIAKNAKGETISLDVAELYEKYCFQPHHELHPKGNVWEIRYFTSPTESEWVMTGRDHTAMENMINAYNCEGGK